MLAARTAARDLAWAAGLVALKSFAMLVALRYGFAQISDDDYARTVIAQSFAHAPRLDPSGTSWLPFPFWLYGFGMMIFGRSLAVARAIAFVLGALAPLPVYAGMRSMHYARIVSAAGAGFAALTPWSVWLGLAPVPEGWVGACAAAALFFLAERPLLAAGLALIASLSRYETWPIAAFIAMVLVVRAARDAKARRVLGGAAVIAALGPIAWLVNNAVAHGDAFHFIARVTAFRRANTTPMPLGARLVEYPIALFDDARAIVAFSVVGVVAAFRDREFRSRWAIPLGGAALGLAFLIYGDVRDGAPTHHAVRALVPVFTVLAAFGVAGAAALARSNASRAVLGIALAVVSVSAVRRVRFPPGAGASEQRDAQIARGRELAKSPGISLEITPCAYEHFALVAAFGAPERVTVNPSTHDVVTRDCPIVTIGNAPPIR